MAKPTSAQIAAQAELEAAYAEAEACNVHVVRYRFPQPDKVRKLMLVADKGRLSDLCSAVLQRAGSRPAPEWDGGELELGPDGGD